MIEIIKEETIEERDKRRREEGFSLPKNIRQIGEVEEGTKVYIEDYVMTYFKQLATYEAESEMVLILYGYRKEITGTCYYFVNGAVRVKEVNSYLHNTLFEQEDWKKINEEAASFFGMLSVLGWALMKLEDTESLEDRIARTHKEFFRIQQPIFVKYMIADKEEKVYLFQNGVMQEQKGHYVYYDRNEMMQNYLISLREEENKMEEEQVDHAAKQFRMVVQEKREQRKRRKTNALLYATSLVLAFVIVLIGITMLGHYEKMRDMEKVLYQIANITSTQERNVDEESMSGQALADEDEMDALIQPTINQPESEVASSLNTQNSTSNAAEGNLTLQEGASNVGIGQNSNSLTMNLNGQAVSVNVVSGNAVQAGVDSNDFMQETTTQAEVAEPYEAQTDVAQANLGQTAEMQADITQTAEMETDATQAAEMETDATQTAQTQTSQEEDEPTQQTTAPVYQTYQIKWGDTLEKINQKFYGNVNRIDEICALNNIQNKDNICYGEKILLPQ